MQNRRGFISAALTATTTTNIFNPPTLTGGVNGVGSATYAIIYHIRISNTTASAINVALWRGATGANVNPFVFAGAATAGALTQGVSVPANSSIECYGIWRFDSADFLVGGASATGLQIQLDGEFGIAG
jgi:hypothetical protein